ncbi:sister chromatid cohesion protein PDS5 homolog B-like isoform X1 [Rhopilema esculentum]|uniref:sister chromatid cohesion protein PDS5 homolog B-like isoform X1 n=1 Tax=Rhopilema esculentum TaxID=499914 RepID=UPI0031DAE066
MSDRRSAKKSKSKELTEQLSKDELLRRLKSIMEELANVDQEENVENYDELAAVLVASFLVNHKDKDVRVCLACCYADILRIYVPEPPYNYEQLKVIFDLILNQLKIIENPESALFKKAYYLLESLAIVKTFNVCCEMDAQDLVVRLFKTFLKIVNEKQNARVKGFMLDVMSSVIQDSESLSQDILDVILINLVNPVKSSRPSSYKLASNLIERCSTSLEPYLQVFFNDALVLGKETESDMNKHMYDLILELNRISKTILLSILPQLEFKLKSVEEDERLEVVKVLGTMFSEEDSDLSNMNKPLWKSFLDRFIDISTDVRVECLQSGKQLLVSKPDLMNDVADRILERFHDTEEKVRLQAVISVCEAAAERIDSVPEKLMSAVKERMRDKKWPVRRAALTCTAKLYKGITISETPDPDAIKRVSWVPDKILHLYYQNSIEDKLCVERIVHGCLVPVSLETKERMDVLLNLYSSLEDYALKAFDFLLKHRSSMNCEFRKLLELHENDENGKEKLMFTKILILARSLPEPFKAQENLKKFVMMFKDNSLFNLLKTSTDVQQGCDRIKKAVSEIVMKISAKNPIIETVKALLDRSSPMLIDAHSIKALFQSVKKSVEGMDDNDDEENDDEMCGDEIVLSKRAKRGLLLLQSLSTVMPVIFKTKECFEELLQLIKHQDDFVVETGVKILFNVGDDLESFDRSLCSCFQPVLSKLAVSGTRKQAIYSIRCLSKTLKDSSVVMDRLLSALLKVLDYNAENLMTTLASLGEVATLAPNIFESKHKEVIIQFVVKDLIIVDRESATSSQESDDEWGDEEEISNETQLKIQGIKLMVKWLLGLQSNFSKAATPVFRLLNTILENDGDVNEQGLLRNKDKSRMRLAAANGILKLVENVHYADVISVKQFLRIAWTVQDSCYEVRQKFSVKLHKALEVLKLPLDYLAFFMLSAVDPSKDRRNQARQMIAKNAQTRRDYIKQNPNVASRPYTILPEYALPYVIYLMAHNPDFDPKKGDSLSEAKEYLWFFLEPLLGSKAENSSFLKKLAENIKQVQDAEDPDNDVSNEKLYVICDIVIWLLTNKIHTLVLKDFPGNPVLPKKLFHAAKKPAKPNTKNYLPASFHLPPKPKKPGVIEMKPVPTKVSSSKRSTRVRLKGDEFKVLMSKVVEEKQDEKDCLTVEDNVDDSSAEENISEEPGLDDAVISTNKVDESNEQETVEVQIKAKGKKSDLEDDGKLEDKIADHSDASSLMAESVEELAEEVADVLEKETRNLRLAGNKRSKVVPEETPAVSSRKRMSQKKIERTQSTDNDGSFEEEVEKEQEKEAREPKIVPEERPSEGMSVKRKRRKK